MKHSQRAPRPLAAWLLPAAVLLPAFAPTAGPVPAPDEGMWTFDRPPLEQLQARYGFTPPEGWLDRVQRASVRFNSGGSGSFVSPQGLILTNHHVISGDLQKVSSPERDYLKDGFLARTLAEELPVPDLELNVLLSIEDVTARVRGAVEADMSGPEAAAARRAAISTIESEERERTGLRCDVVPLYGGAEYSLYRFKRYTDVRIVFAPEKDAAFFGGDPDNFTYPRYCLDFAFLRAWEDGKPARPPGWLKWSQSGAADGGLVFVSGHPGSTGRLDTVAKMEFFRDHAYPEILNTIERRLEALRAYGERGPEEKRQVTDDVFSLENSRKAFTGYLQSLRNPEVLARKRAEEEAIRKAAGREAEEALERVAAARRAYGGFFREQLYGAPRGRLAGTAVQIVEYLRETRRPNHERLPRYRDSALESTRFAILSPAPVHPGLEEVTLGLGLREALEELGPDSPHVRALLDGRDPRAVAAEAVSRTRVGDVEFRKKLLDGGLEAAEAADDPMVRMALRVQPLLRDLNRRLEEELQSVETAANERLAAARFLAFGRATAPDATFTLRLSFGVVTGYEQGTTLVPWTTTFHGLFERHVATGGRSPWELPERFHARRHRLDLATPLNFVCTADITGGNSGSPVLNRDAEVVGVVFDGNIQSLGNRFVYDEEQARAVSVHSAAIIESLSRLYDAGELLAEILGGRAEAVEAGFRKAG